MLTIAKSSKLAKKLHKAIHERGKCLIKRITMELISVIKLSHDSSMFEKYALYNRVPMHCIRNLNE